MLPPIYCWTIFVRQLRLKRCCCFLFFIFFFIIILLLLLLLMDYKSWTESVFQRRIRITKFQGFAGESKKQSSHSHCMPVSQSVVLNVALGRFLVFQRSVVVFFCFFAVFFLLSWEQFPDLTTALCCTMRVSSVKKSDSSIYSLFPIPKPIDNRFGDGWASSHSI